MKFYEKLSSVGFLKNSYVFKFLFIAFIGIHIPLIGILFFVLYAKANFSVEMLLLFSLVMTLIATTITLMILKKLIHPIELASKALKDYRRKRIIPDLPLHFSDEAGLLLTNIHNSIQESEDFIAEKQDLIYLLSHDLKTFAANPKTLAQMIIGTNPADEVKELAELICDSSKEQFQYIENFIRILKEQDEMLKTSSEIKTMNLDELFEKVKDQMNQKLNSKNIQLIKNLAVNNVTLRIDSELLMRVFFNLINNAIKFSFTNTIIQFESYNDEKNVYIKVIDEGIGFDNKDVDKMFAKFTKMSRLGTMNEYSTGIGLYLSRQVIERNEGQLTARSEGKNKGGIFTIILPLVK